MAGIDCTSCKNYKAIGQKKSRLAFSKVLALLILLGDIGLSAGTLYLCHEAIQLQFTGELGYLVTLIGLYQVATGYVLGKYFKKSQAENTAGGIVYDSALGNRDPNEI